MSVQMSARSFGVAMVMTACLLLAAGPAPAAAGTGNGPAPSESVASLQKFFKGQESKASSPAIDFEVAGGYADIQTGAPKSSGRYFLAASHVDR